MPRPVCGMVLKIQKGARRPAQSARLLDACPSRFLPAASLQAGVVPRREGTPGHGKSPAAGALRRDAYSSASITSNSSFALSFSRWSRNFSMSKRFFSSQSAVYWKLGCFVRSYLSDRNGLTPRSWRMHLPPSSTASSSTLANSWPVRW